MIIRRVKSLAFVVLLKLFSIKQYYVHFKDVALIFSTNHCLNFCYYWLLIGLWRYVIYIRGQRDKKRRNVHINNWYKLDLLFIVAKLLYNYVMSIFIRKVIFLYIYYVLIFDGRSILIFVLKKPPLFHDFQPY